jgi:SOS-response transcriptional repressor LexA
MARRMVPLTATQKRVFDAICSFIAEKAHSPSFAEIGELTGHASSATINKHVYNLAAKGMISYSPGRSRSITVLRAPDATVCPLCGKAKGAAA